MSALLPALLIAAAMLGGLLRGTDVYAAMTEGARKGLRLSAEILPALLVLFPAVRLLRASGLPERLDLLLSPLLFREKLTGKKLLCAALAILGMVFVSGAAEAASMCGRMESAGQRCSETVGRPGMISV